MVEKVPTRFILLKVANRCNLNCTYCYWFKDQSVYEKSRIIRPDVLLSFYEKLKRHIIKYRLPNFSVSIHGGEPLLAGKKLIRSIFQQLVAIGIDTNCQIKFHLQTNGILIDEDWINLFKEFNVNLGVSFDGLQSTHDTYRRDLQDRPTFDRTLSVVKLLQSNKVTFGILAVCDPFSDPGKICEFFVDEIGLKSFDVLIPHANYESATVPKITDFYISLMKLWYERYQAQGVDIRIVKNIFRGILGKRSQMQTIGFVPIDTCMIKPEGEIEALDSLHSLGYNSTKSELNILNNEIDEIWNDKFWNEVFYSSQHLHEKCLNCKYQYACGGGHIVSRWSKDDRFNNPSVFCDQLYEIFEHTANYLMSKVNDISY